MRVRATTAWREDIGAGFIRIPKLVRNAIGVDLGDPVLAKGPAGEVVLKAVIADRSEIGKRVAGIDGATRRALGVELGAYITVSKPQPRRSKRQGTRATQTHWLFNYGSNNPEQLEKRLGHPVSEMHAAYLPGYRLKFLGYSYNREGGVAGLVKKRGAEACGYVCRVSDRDLDGPLDTHEGVSGGFYYRAILPVMKETASGDFEQVYAVVYLPGPQRLNAPEHHYPSEEYLEAVEKTIFGFWDEDGECRDYLDAALGELGSTFNARRNPKKRPTPSERRKQALERKAKFDAAQAEGRWPYGPYPEPCENCGGDIEIKVCNKSGCWAPGKHYHMWQTSPDRWEQLPRAHRNQILCKKCFKKLSGIAPGPYYQGNPSYFSNPDRDMRELERAIHAGDIDLIPQYVSALVRAGRMGNQTIEQVQKDVKRVWEFYETLGEGNPPEKVLQYLNLSPEDQFCSMRLIHYGVDNFPYLPGDRILIGRRRRLRGTIRALASHEGWYYVDFDEPIGLTDHWYRANLLPIFPLEPDWTE